MPYQCDDNYDLFVEYIGKISSIIEESVTSNLIVLGDFNAAVDSVFESELLEMCKTYQLVVSDYAVYGRVSGQYTYVGDVHCTTSWLDHVLCSQDIQSKLKVIDILDRLPSSDHLPLSVIIDVQVHSGLSVSSVYSSPRDQLVYNWAKTDITDVNNYCMQTYRNFSKISIPSAIKCRFYAYEFTILFNLRKSKLMCFNVNVHNLDITLCGEKVIHCDSETYLGVSLNSNITDRAITQTVCSFYQKSNHVIGNYSMLDSFSRCKLHTIFCMSLYGSELWNYNSRYIEELDVAWRKTMRKLFRLPYRTHNYIVCSITEDIFLKLHRRVTKFMYSMIHSDNDTVRLMTTFFLSTEASLLAENFRYIMYTYNIPMFTWYKELSVLLKCLTYPSSLSDIELSNIDTVRELLSIRDEVLICPISHSAAGTLHVIDYDYDYDYEMNLLRHKYM